MHYQNPKDIERGAIEVQEMRKELEKEKARTLYLQAFFDAIKINDRDSAERLLMHLQISPSK